eukprot:2697054-Rhodomonas_salina.2
MQATPSVGRQVERQHGAEAVRGRARGFLLCSGSAPDENSMRANADDGAVADGGRGVKHPLPLPILTFQIQAIHSWGRKDVVCKLSVGERLHLAFPHALVVDGALVQRTSWQRDPMLAVLHCARMDPCARNVCTSLPRAVCGAQPQLPVVVGALVAQLARAASYVQHAFPSCAERLESWTGKRRELFKLEGLDSHLECRCSPQ